jgi:hypothetical protein
MNGDGQYLLIFFQDHDQLAALFHIPVGTSSICHYHYCYTVLQSAVSKLVTMSLLPERMESNNENVM